MLIIYKLDTDNIDYLKRFQEAVNSSNKSIVVSSEVKIFVINEQGGVTEC